MKSIKVCEYSRSTSFHYDLILQDQASGERSQDQWSSGILFFDLHFLLYYNTYLFDLHFLLFNTYLFEIIMFLKECTY